LRRQADAHRRAAQHPADQASALVKIEPFNPEIASFDRAEPSHIAGRVKADGLIADAGSERVLRQCDDIF
jgi:hypothetical protein